VVLAHGSEIDWKLPPASWTVSILFKRSRLERASLSSFQMTMTSPGRIWRAYVGILVAPIEAGNLFAEDLSVSRPFPATQLKVPFLILGRDTRVDDFKMRTSLSLQKPRIQPTLCGIPLQTEFWQNLVLPIPSQNS